MLQLKDLGAQKVCLPCLFHLQQWDCELATNLKIAEFSIRSLPLFKFSVPLHLLIQIVCTDHWSGRNCRWTPEHCTSHHSVTCFLANQEPFRMSQGDWSLGVLLVRTLADSKRHSSWWSCPPFQFAETVAIAASYQCPNNGATASSVRNGKTQPTHRLGCTRVVRTLSFPYAIPLWSSIEQWDCERVSRKSQQHRNPSLTKGKQMSCCRIQVAPGGSRGFSKPWHWIWLHSLCLFFKTPQSFAHKPGQKQVPSGATFIFYITVWSCAASPGYDSPRASICHQGTEASLLELRRFMTLGGLGVPDSPNTTGWPPRAFQGLAHMDLQGKQPHLQKAWFLEIWPWVGEKENSPKWTGWMEACWMSFSFWLSIDHSRFTWEYGWIRPPWFWDEIWNFQQEPF